ncbi:hypothetical protein RUM43_009921 [Polyplax serrata]|uniref:Uncharacterized protein n=1 Tax=Polyplax serrata TaxID=468196 RepID=A0AAN8Q434_POLSC
MATESFSRRVNATDVTLKCLILFLITGLASGYSYPMFGGKRYRTVPIRRSYISLPVTRLRNDYQVPEYQETYMPSTQEDFEYNSFDKYPFVQYYGYYPGRNYYRYKNSRRSLDGYGFYEDQMPQEDVSDDGLRQGKDDAYPYGEETWYEEEPVKFDRNSEANKAFLQNLIMAQMYQDARNQYPYGYDSNSDDYDDQHWFYGVPTTEVEDKEKVKQYFKNKEDEEVTELESLASKKVKSKKLKEKDAYKKGKNKGSMEKPTKPKSKMTEDEYFDMQKQLVANSRKNGYLPGADEFKLNKKQVYDSAESKNNFWEFYKPQKLSPEASINSNLNVHIKDDRNVKAFSDSNVNVETTTYSTSVPATRRPATVGQKEVVLPRPSNPVRRPFDISTRSLHQPSVYDTIKKLLKMEKELQQVSTTNVTSPSGY